MRDELKKLIEEKNIVRQGKKNSLFVVKKNISKELKEQIILSTERM